MVAAISGGNLGLSLTSLDRQGSAGLASQGRNGEAAYVNVTTGNLVLQDQDDRLISRGPDIAAIRTYNSQGLFNDDNADNWSLGTYSQQLQLSGALLSNGSTVVRTARDGAQAVYSYDSTRNLYVSTDGAGAYDTISYEALSNQFIWKDGDSGLLERYENSAQGRLLAVTDPQGNTSSYSYSANGTLASIASANGEAVYFDYVGTLLSDIRVVTNGGAVATRTYYNYDASGRLASVSTDLSPDDNSLADGRKYTVSYSYDGSSQRLISTTQSDGTSLSFTYVQVGGGYRVASVTDGTGQVTSYTYDLANRYTTVTDPLGLVTTYSYDTAGQLTQIGGPAVGGASPLRSFAYNARGDIVQIVDGEGNVTSLEYDASGNQILQRDAAGNTVTRSYDANNQLIAETIHAVADPDGAGAAQPSVPLTTRYVYDAAGKNLLRFSVSAEGRVTEYRYDSYGQRIASVQYSAAVYDISGLSTSAVPSESAMLSWVGAQNKALTSRSDFSYDFRGQLQSATRYTIVDASGDGVLDSTQSVTQYVYSQRGQLLQTIAADGGVTAYTYDGLGRVLSAQNALTQTTLTSYDDTSRKTSISYANGLIETSTFDVAGRLISVLQTNSAGANLGGSQYFHDADGRLRMTQDATGVRIWMLYDEAGRKVADIDGNGSLTEYIYNKNDLVTQSIAYANAVNVAALVNASGQPLNVGLAAIRPSASAQDRKSWRAYDAANRLVKTVDAQGAVTENIYDGAGRVVSTIHYAALIATAGFGSAPAAASIAPVAGAADRVSRCFYDADGKLRATLDAEGYLTELRYDPAGQLSSRTAYANATDVIHRSGGALAQLLPPASSADQTSYFLYNGKGQVAGEIDAEGYLTEKIYDTAGNLTQSIRYASKIAAPALAAISTATTVANVRPAGVSEDHISSSVYDLLGRVTQQTDAQGVLTQYSYDIAGHLIGTVRAVGSGEARGPNARYDLQGRLTGELTGEGAALLTGDLTQAQIDTIWAQYGLSHSYDAAGRRTSTTDQNGNRTLFFYDLDGHLTHSINALGEITENQYDTLGQLCASIRYGNRISLAALTGANAGGLVNTVLTNAVDAIRNAAQDSKTSYSYNTSGTLASSIDALGYAISAIYNAFGEEVSRTQTIAASRSVVQTTSYDRRGLQTGSLADPGGINAATGAVYDAFGRLIQSTDANGNVRQQNHDRLGRIVLITDPLNASRTTSYDAFDRVLAQTDATGKTTSYSYNTSARSLTVTTPEGVAITTVLNRHGQTQSVTDGRGKTTSYAYDKNGNLLSTTTALTATSSTYDHANRLIQTIDANGNTVQLGYDAANRLLTRTVDPGGLNLITYYQYDAKGRQISVTDPGGILTQFIYDLKGQLLQQIVDPSGLNLATQYTYDGRGKTLTLTSAGGAVTRYSYDDLGRRVQELTDPGGLNVTRNYAYDSHGNVTSVTDANGNITRYAYDANDRLVYTLSPLGSLSRMDYDAEGRIVKTTAYATALNLAGLGTALTVAQLQALAVANAAQDLVEHRLYDGNGRLKATINSLGEVVQYSHDDNNNVIERVAYANRINMSAWTAGSLPAVSADAAHDQRLRTVYDQLNRAIYTMDGRGAVVVQQYDGNGNVIDRVAYATTVAPATPANASDLANAVAAIANPNVDAHERLTYDRANRQTWSVNGMGAVTQLVYDANGNVVRKIQYATAVAAGAQPDSVSASGDDRVSAYAYDAANRRVYSVDALGGVQQTVYDNNSNVTLVISYANRMAAPTAGGSSTVAGIASALIPDASNDRATRYAYDSANRLTLSVDAQGTVTDTTFDAAGHVLQTRRYATLINTTGLSATATDAQVRALLVADAANDRIERNTYDAGGRPIYTINSLGYVSKASYDALGRITASTHYANAIALGGGYTTTAAVDTLLAPDAAYDRTDQFTYDAAGRLVSSTDALGYTESYAHDGLGNKVGFTNKLGAVWTYSYDAAGHLVQETSPQVALTGVSTDATGNLVVDEAQSANAAIVTAMRYDALGNLTSRTEAQGRPEARTTRYEYDALGRQIRIVYPDVGVYSAQADNLTVNGATGVATRTETVMALYTQVTYDTLGNAVANRDVAGNYSYKAYDAAGHVQYDVDAMGYVTGYARNAWAEVTQLTRYGAAATLGSGNPPKLSTTQISSYLGQSGVDHGADRTLLTEYDRLGRSVRVTEPQVYAFDSDAQTGAQYFAASKVTRNSYTAFGELRSVTVLKNPVTDTWTTANVFYYDRVGQKTAAVDALGYLSTWAYDAAGNAVAATEYATALASWNGAAAPANVPGAALSEDDRTVLTTRDRLNRKVSEVRLNVEYSDASTLASSSVSLRGNLITTYGYDAVGNLTRTTDANGASTYTYYDALGRIKAVAAPTRNSTLDGASLPPLTAFRLDAYGNVLVRVDYANGAASASEAAYSAAAADAADRTELAQYDRFGHATQKTDAQGNNHYTSFDAQGHAAKEWQGVTGNDGITHTLFKAYQYDKLGHLTHTLDPASTTVFKGGITVGSLTSATAQPTYMDFGSSDAPLIQSGYALSGTNQVVLAWPSVVDANAGLVRVQLDYRTVDTYFPTGYDEYGNVTSFGGMRARDVSRTQYFEAGNALSGVTLNWANASSVDGGISSLNYIRVWQQDAAGNWVIKWEGTRAQTNGSGVATVTQAEAGVTDTALEYNAFGEVTRKGVNGGRQEYFAYDDAGHLWRTNAGDGKDKVFLYDVQGHQTAHIQSAGSGRGDVNLHAFTSADQIAALADVRRTDMRYDALGHLVMTAQPERIDAQGGLAVTRNYALATIASSASMSFTNYRFDSEGYLVQPSASWGGVNTVDLSWASLAGLGNGDVKIIIDYANTIGTIVDDTSYNPEYGFTYSAHLALSAAPVATRTQIVSAEQGVSGIRMSWVDAASGSSGGLTSINRLRVFKKDVYGSWVSVVDQTTFGFKGNTLEVAAPADGSTDVQLQIRPAGSSGDSGWVTQTGQKFDAALRYDIGSLGLGAWEYRVLTTPAGNPAQTTASGTFKLAAPVLAVISNTRSFGPAGQGIFVWAAPGGGIQQALRIRPAGSADAWQTFTVSARGSGYDGVDLNSLVAGNYEYELVWTSPGATAPYAHATGQITVGVAVTTTTVVPPSVIGRVVTGYLLTDAASGGIYFVYNLRWIFSESGPLPEVFNQAVVSDPDGGTYITFVPVPSSQFAPIYSAPTTYTVTTPPPYTASSTTQANTAAVSQDTSAAATITQVAAVNGISQWARPVVTQKVDRWGNVIQISDVRSANWLTHYRYNASNQLVQQTRPDENGGNSANSPTTRLYYDRMGKQVAVQDANGNVNGQVFDQAGQLAAERHADGGIVSYAYNAFGDKVRKTDARNDASTYSYDKLGRLLQTAYAAVDVYTTNTSNQTVLVGNRAITESNTWDQAGRKLSQTNGNGETLRYTYDLRGNVLQTFFPLSGSATGVFDAQNRKTMEVDANGASKLWTYDYFGQLMGHVDLGNNRYTYTYDNARQLIRQTSTLGQNKTYGFDAAGQLSRITDSALNQVSTYAYDLAGLRVQESTVQNGITYQDNHMGYDALGRLRWVGDSRVSVRMDYDKAGNRTRIRTHVINGTATETPYDEDRYFQYDAMNRQTVLDAVDAAGTLGARGHALTYDLNGNRVSDSHQGYKVTASSSVIGRLVTGYVASGFDENGAPTGYTYVTDAAYYGTQPTVYARTVSSYDDYGTTIYIYNYSPISGYQGTAIQGTTYTQSAAPSLVTETYSYDANNRLATSSRDGTLLETRSYDGANRMVRAQANKDLAISETVNGVTRAWSGSKAKEYFDKLYGSGVGGIGSDTRTNRYDANGRLLFAAVSTAAGTARYNINYARADGSANYDAAGNLLGYQLSNYEGTAYTNTYTYSLLKRDSYLEGGLGGGSNLLQGGNATRLYDVNNNLIGVRDATKAANNKDFITDASGRILQSSQNGNIQRQLVVGGETLGRYGVYLNPDKPADASGNPNYITGADFSFGYEAMSSASASQPGTRTVGTGETLQSMAMSAYGDASLWYLIAEANGLSGNLDLQVGQTLTLPARVGGLHNTSSTFKAYNPGQLVGDTTPNLPSPSAGGGGGGCGGLGAIIVIVVTVVVAVYATAYLSEALKFSQLAAGAMGAAAGSVAGQAAGNVLGIQKGFDWNAVALAAVAGGVTGGLTGTDANPGLMAGKGLEMTVARAAISNAMTQGIAVTTGLQKDFSWASVAASAAGAGMGHAMNEALGLTDAAGTVTSLYKGMEKISRAALSGFAAGMTTNAMRGGRLEVTQVATDAFGNALGSSWGEDLARSDAEERLRKQMYSLSGGAQQGGLGLKLGAATAADFGKAVDARIADRAWRLQEAEAYDRGDYVPGGGDPDNELPGMGGATRSYIGGSSEDGTIIMRRIKFARDNGTIYAANDVTDPVQPKVTSDAGGGGAAGDTARFETRNLLRTDQVAQPAAQVEGGLNIDGQPAPALYPGFMESIEPWPDRLNEPISDDAARANNPNYSNEGRNAPRSVRMINPSYSSQVQIAPNSPSGLELAFFNAMGDFPVPTGVELQSRLTRATSNTPETIRKLAVEVAKSWVGTEYAEAEKGTKYYDYRGPGATKNIAGDCSGTLFAIFKEAGATDYPYTSTGSFATEVEKGRLPFVVADKPAPGDIALFSGHMVLVGEKGTLGKNLANGNEYDSLGARRAGITFGPAEIKWFGPATYYRYSPKP